MNQQIVEELLSHFGRTGNNLRPRVRKFHCELLLSKFYRRELVITGSEINRPKEYIDRMVKFSKGFLEYINEDAIEIKLTPAFVSQMQKWHKQYSELDELDKSDEQLSDQGLIVDDNKISFDRKFNFSKFMKIISDEGEAMNDPREWKFSTENISCYDCLDFTDKDSELFSSHLFVLKFYILRKIDEITMVTSRYVHCPKCKANYVVPASRIENQATYKCENYVGEKQCNTSLKKFAPRKMLPTYIFEVAVEVKNGEGTEYKEFFMESFVDFNPGYYSGMVFGRTEAKTSSFYFLCLTAQGEKSKYQFELIITNKRHKFFDLVDSVLAHIKNIGFVIDDDKARLVYYIETIKKMNLTINKEINLDHSMYFGAPGIGKTYALNLLHHMFYANTGFISGPRFSLPGLTGGQKEVFYQDTSRKRNVPGLFSNQAFIFDEINNQQFLDNDNAINLFKSAVLASSGTSSVVGGKEFRRISLIAGTANYDPHHLRHYENRVRYHTTKKGKAETEPTEQENVLVGLIDGGSVIPEDFDYYEPMQSYGSGISRTLKNALLRARGEDRHFMTNFPQPLMERFYWTVLVHPKHDREFLLKKEVNVLEHLKSRESKYTQRELLAQLFVPELEGIILNHVKDTMEKFKNPKVEELWVGQAAEFLKLLQLKYKEFFSMFSRINQVHVFTLYTLSLINNETELSYETKRIYERIISLCHNAIPIYDFHNPSFEDFRYIGESRSELINILEKFGEVDIRLYVDTNRRFVQTVLAKLVEDGRIIKVSDYIYRIGKQAEFEVPNNVEASFEEKI